MLLPHLPHILAIFFTAFRSRKELCSVGSNSDSSFSSISSGRLYRGWLANQCIRDHFFSQLSLYYYFVAFSKPNLFGLFASLASLLGSSQLSSFSSSWAMEYFCCNVSQTPLLLRSEFSRPQFPRDGTEYPLTWSSVRRCSQFFTSFSLVFRYLRYLSFQHPSASIFSVIGLTGATVLGFFYHRFDFYCSAVLHCLVVWRGFVSAVSIWYSRNDDDTGEIADRNTTLIYMDTWRLAPCIFQIICRFTFHNLLT